MRVLGISDLARVERLEAEWRELWERDPAATPFQSPDWLIPWIGRLWGGGHLAFLALRHGERLTAVAPLFLWGYGPAAPTIRLSWAGSGISDYLGMTCEPGSTGESAAAVLEWIRACPDWHTADLQEQRAGSPLLEAASGMAGWTVSPCSVCPTLELRANRDEQLAAGDARFRRNLKIAEKRLRAAGRAEFVEANDGGHEELLDELFRLHTGRWRERGEDGMLSSEKLEGFHREIARRFCTRGFLRLFVLHVEGSPIAVQYNFAAKGRVYAYLSGFDTAWSRVSPGALVLAHSIAAAIGEGAAVLDFLRKREDFKYAWGATDRENFRLSAARGQAGVWPETCHESR